MDLLATDSSFDGTHAVERRGADLAGWTAPARGEARLLTLPLELRMLIWHTYFTWPRKPFIRWAADFSGIEYSFEGDERLIFVCRQVYEEVLPIFAANIQLHITYQGHTPRQPSILPSRDICRRIESVFFHCTNGHSSVFDLDRPPKAPFRFHRFPSMKRFTVCKPMLVLISRLATVDGASGMTQEMYKSLSEEEKLEAWNTTGLISARALIDFVARFGRGGWLSRVVDPEDKAGTHDSQNTDSADEDDEDDPTWMFYSTDDEDLDKENPERKREILEARNQEVIDQAHTILEVDLSLYDDECRPPLLAQVLLVTVDMKTRQINETRFLSEEEASRRRMEALEAT